MRPPPSLQHMGSPKLESTNQIPQTDGGMDSEGEEDFEPEEGTDGEEGTGNGTGNENGKKGEIEREKRKYTKQKKIPIEDVFEQVENLYIRRGRARPDHNDQGTVFLKFFLF